MNRANVECGCNIDDHQREQVRLIFEPNGATTVVGGWNTSFEVRTSVTVADDWNTAGWIASHMTARAQDLVSAVAAAEHCCYRGCLLPRLLHFPPPLLSCLVHRSRLFANINPFLFFFSSRGCPLTHPHSGV